MQQVTDELACRKNNWLMPILYKNAYLKSLKTQAFFTIKKTTEDIR